MKKGTTALPDPIEIPSDLPVLIVGPTASGKSALALEIARDGGVVVNSDALQVWSCWRVLSARPSAEDEIRAPHLLYGHVAPGAEYSVGHWLRDLAPILAAHRAGGPRPVIVGGTGLYLSALTAGLAEIPATPPEIRAEANRHDTARLLAELDAPTAARIDRRNPMRVQRAWEVLRATGRGLAQWQDETPPPLLPLAGCVPLVLDADRDWLAARIDQRFNAMIAQGALEEVRAVVPFWDAAAPWAKAIGAPELVAHLAGTLPLDAAVAEAQAATRQYAKRQRTWFRARMRDWHKISRP